LLKVFGSKPIPKDKLLAWIRTNYKGNPYHRFNYWVEHAVLIPVSGLADQYQIGKLGISNLSFGIEFEANARNKQGVVRYIPHRFAHLPNWDYQADPTASFELRSPVWTDINDAFNDTVAQFKFWMEANPGLVPFFKPCKTHWSLGGHIHKGYKAQKVSKRDGKALVRKMVAYLPFLYYISCNGKVEKYLSARMIERPYSPIKRDSILKTHREEWYLSPHGTIEFRRFDANVPAVQLTIAYLLNLAHKHGKPNDIPMTRFQTTINAICSFPPDYKRLLETREVFKTFKNVNITKIPKSIKEVLILSFVYLKNPALFVGTFDYDFCKDSALGKFLKAKKWKGDRKKVADKILAEINNYKTFNDLLTKVILDRETYYWFRLMKIPCKNTSLLDSNVKKSVEKYITKKSKKPPFIKKRAWLNFHRIKTPKFKELKDLTPTQLQALATLANTSIDKMFARVEKYFVWVAGDDVRGYVLINRPKQKLVEIKGNIPESKIKMMVRLYVRNRSGH